MALVSWSRSRDVSRKLTCCLKVPANTGSYVPDTVAIDRTSSAPLSELHMDSASTHTHTQPTWIAYQLATDSQILTLTLALLTLYDPGIPEHTIPTLLTLHEPRNKSFCKRATSPVDRHVASVYIGENPHKCRQLKWTSPTYRHTEKG